MKQKERFDEKPKQEHTEPKHHRKAVIKGIFYLLGSVLLATAVLSFLIQQSQGVEALQMLIGGFVIFMVPQVVGSMVILLELAAVMLRQVWYI